MDWKPYIPTDHDVQESAKPWAETNGCMAFATVHCIEIQEKYLTGMETNYSEQILCVKSGTSPQSGNSVSKVINTLEAIGLVKTSVSPEPVDFTVQQFYVQPDPKIVATGQEWLKRWSVSRTSVDPALALTYLDKSPVLITIDLNPDGDKTGFHQYHEVVLLNDHEYFDSYGELVKPMTFTTGQPHRIYFANLLIIKEKNMTNAEFVHKAGTSEYGFYLPALDESALLDKAMNFDLDISGPVGGSPIDFSKAKEVSGL